VIVAVAMGAGARLDAQGTQATIRACVGGGGTLQIVAARTCEITTREVELSAAEDGGFAARRGGKSNARRAVLSTRKIFGVLRNCVLPGPKIVGHEESFANAAGPSYATAIPRCC
jgi:hypothetical protein